MVFIKEERFYTEGRKMWLKHGSWDKNLTYQTVKRTTIKLFFIPLIYWEKVVKSDLV